MLFSFRSERTRCKYGITTDVFLKEVIEKRVINGKEIFCMTTLLDKFKKMAKGIENEDTSSFRYVYLSCIMSIQSFTDL